MAGVAKIKPFFVCAKGKTFSPSQISRRTTQLRGRRKMYNLPIISQNCTLRCHYNIPVGKRKRKKTEERYIILY